MSDIKICTNCKIEKPISEFHRNGNGFKSHCKDCKRLLAPVRIIGKCKCGCGKDLVVKGYHSVDYIAGHHLKLPRNKCRECNTVLPLKNKSGYCRLHVLYHKVNSLSLTMTDEERLSRTKSQIRNSHLKSAYGITLEMYNKMLVEQDFKCCLCGKEHEYTPQKGLCVDHDHKTGRVRGLVCRKCNLVLIYFDNSDYRNKCLNYIGAQQ